MRQCPTVRFGPSSFSFWNGNYHETAFYSPSDMIDCVSRRYRSLTVAIRQNVGTCLNKDARLTTEICPLVVFEITPRKQGCRGWGCRPYITIHGTRRSMSLFHDLQSSRRIDRLKKIIVTQRYINTDAKNSKGYEFPLFLHQCTPGVKTKSPSTIETLDGFVLFFFCFFNITLLKPLTILSSFAFRLSNR